MHSICNSLHLLLLGCSAALQPPPPPSPSPPLRTWQTVCENQKYGTSLCDGTYQDTTISLVGFQGSGHVPTELGLLTQLESIHIALKHAWSRDGSLRGEISGTLPSEMNLLASLVSLRIDSGSPWVCSVDPAEPDGTVIYDYGFPHDYARNCQGSRISGTLPSSLNLPQLTTLDLNYLQLSGTLPTELALSTDLTSLRVTTPLAHSLSGQYYEAPPDTVT